MGREHKNVEKDRQNYKDKGLYLLLIEYLKKKKSLPGLFYHFLSFFDMFTHWFIQQILIKHLESSKDWADGIICPPSTLLIYIPCFFFL